MAEVAADENFFVAGDADFLAAARGGDGKTDKKNRQHGKRNPVHGARLLHSPRPAKKFFARNNVIMPLTSKKRTNARF
jgi:hypothetical protein